MKYWSSLVCVLPEPCADSFVAPLAQLAPNRISGATRAWMIVLRAYLLVAVGMVVFRVVQLALG